MENKRKLGQAKEEAAAQFLLQEGFTLLERNYYFPGGEIDLIARDQEYLVFIEVKYRKNTGFGFPEEAVTVSKQRKLALGARRYLYEHRISPETPCRFDVISICGNELVRIENAFCLT